MNETPTLKPLFNDVVRKRDLFAFLTAAVNAKIITIEFSMKCIESLPTKGSRCKWGARSFDLLRNLELHVTPKATSTATTPRWIQRQIALAEDAHAGFDDETAGCI